MPDSIGAVFAAPNLCQCGHDYTSHTNPGSFGGGSCLICAVATGHGLHAFTSDKEIWPSSAFAQTLPVGFVATPFPTPFNPPNSQSSGTFGAGTTNIGMTVAVPAGVQAGMIANITQGGFQLNYLITGVSGTILRIAPPGLFVGITAGAVVSYQTDSDGSTIGGNSPPNGQRGG